MAEVEASVSPVLLKFSAISNRPNYPLVSVLIQNLFSGPFILENFALVLWFLKYTSICPVAFSEMISG